MKNLNEGVAKVLVLYGVVLFTMGIIGMIYPESARFIVSFCFIYGGSTLIQGVLRLAKLKKEKAK